ncbi:MAG: peptidylprolyl isomerase [Corynebacteriales bacterium]|nr:peptidylprolyl isomerase [Mycobacteriales bacterium]
MGTKDRQRAQARAKLERQMARRAEAAKKRRQIIAGIAAVVGLAVLVTGAIFLVNFLDDDEKDTGKKESATQDCTYFDPPTAENIKDVGKPPVSGFKRTGTATVTIDTNFGPIKFEMDRALAPCTANSWEYLVGKKFFDNTICPRHSDNIIQCGNPFGTLSGGPSYVYNTENLPTGMHPSYPTGTVAMAKGQEDPSVGSQFFIVTQDWDLDPAYTVIGKVTEGLDILETLRALGNDGSMDPNPGGGAPNQEIKINTVTIEG